MRQIKFRACDRKEKQMIPDALGVANIGLGDGSLVVSSDAQRGNELDWMQFTGLLDKNGKEIFEGDIVKFCHWNDCDTNDERAWKTGKIIWDESGYRFTIFPKTPMNSLYKSKMYEVIGNIYANPELLKS